ncbi:FAD-dependent oxidoreductase [Streptomyces sp. DSM 44915]|uniref:FAD-dependent oxidoreductase n=1 Tax=Streptomyces chisholmiae TaxID=3075540 RepID=A0ABU2JND0_9ACTN|nr:FAD-dependent oxidoreductase [Streptomyces sp. DSM 44915]MDT0266014.1 FAD-dependent oxidoreductase [Streptomyces sp. DSM 44915]
MSGAASAPASVLIVGASAAGLATAEALRRRGYPGALTVLGAEPHPPYDRPPLSKQLLAGHWDAARTRLRAPAALAALSADFLLGDPAVALDAADRTVHTAAGRTLRADRVVIATGLRPRALPGRPRPAGVHPLRTLDDALALRAALRPATRLVVVGDGVLGSEVAATAATAGDLDVTLVGPRPAPMAGQLGPVVAAELAALHTEHGVRLRPGSAVVGLTEADGRVTGVRLATGAVLPADVVVLAIGAEPNTAWLAGSGLRIADGVVCDAHCRAADGVYAAGDVARWHHLGFDRLVRWENRANATEQALAVAGALLGDERPYRPVPSTWTDQFDARLQLHGLPAAGDTVTIAEGAIAERRFVAVYRRGDTVTGVLGWNMPKQARLLRHHLTPTPAS